MESRITHDTVHDRKHITMQCVAIAIAANACNRCIWTIERNLTFEPHEQHIRGNTGN